MRIYGRSAILAVAGVSGGLFFALLSGLYMVKPLVMDVEIIDFGFPLPWLEAVRSTWIPKPPLSWQYYFFWYNFIADFVIYGLLTVTAVYLCLVAFAAVRKRGKNTL